MATPSCTSKSSLAGRNKKKETIKRESMGVRKGAWSREKDELLKKCIETFGEGKWSSVPLRAGLKRCRKSCRLRWLNYLSPAINREKFSDAEIDLIFRLHKLLGNRWSLIAGRIPGRTANDIKNFWNTHLSKKRLLVQDFPKIQDTEYTINYHHLEVKETSNDEDDDRRRKVEAVYKPQPKRLSSTKNLNHWSDSNIMLQHKEPTITTITANESILKDLMNEENMSLDYEFSMMDEALLLGAVNEWEELLNS